MKIKVRLLKVLQTREVCGHARRKFFKFLGSEIPFSAFSAGDFAVNKYEGKCNSYLFNLHLWCYR